jgi:hypothetical protein
MQREADQPKDHQAGRSEHRSVAVEVTRITKAIAKMMTASMASI